MTDVRAISLHQPWASLIALGVKSIETRSWSTRYRGRLLIHAAKQTQYGPCGGGYGVKRHVNEDPILVHPHSTMGRHETRLPVGAVVASCVLTDCVRIGAEHWFRSANWEGDEQEYQDEAVIVACDGSYNRPRLCLDTPGRGLRDVSDQEPFGDFTPGRWAWLLDDVKPTTERCPRCWVTRAQADAGYPYGPRCATCEASGACGPVPLRGRQGVWRPEWDGVRV